MKDQSWLDALAGDEPERGKAIDDLRVLLVRGLSKSLSTRYGAGTQVDDIVQDAIMKILNSLDSFEGRSRFTTWAMTIATRVGISELRRRHYKDVSFSSMSTGDNLTFEIPEVVGTPPDKGLDRSKVLQTLRQLVDSELTVKQRAATQGLLDGLPIEEIARRLNSNRNAVYKLIHDARSRLRDGFAKAGLSSDDVLSIFS